MQIFKAMRSKEWAAVQEKGILKFYLDHWLSTAALGIVVFSVVDFAVNFDQQTGLMKTGMLWSLVFPCFSGLFFWYLLGRKFGNTPKA